jgi:hypothetical protein
MYYDKLLASTQLTWLSSPSVRIMKKNNTAQTGEIGICAIASGYTTNTSPGPMKINIIIIFHREQISHCNNNNNL